ncbi:MAG: ATP-binding protein [Rhodothermales bacterium]|nr:ATP-binding protein [Rhodothermales bacterium]
MMTKGSPIEIVITGAESTGKTTLAYLLGQYFDCPVVPEQLRLFVDHHGRLPQEEDVPGIVEDFLRAKRDALKSSHRLTIFDTDLLSTLIYHQHYFGSVKASLEALAHAETGDYYLLADDDFPWVPDSMQRESAEIRSSLQRRFRAELESRQLPHVTVSGSIEERLSTAAAWIDNRLVL